MALWPSMRKRLENWWIKRLNAQLNKKVKLHYAFSGDLAARNADALAAPDM